MTSGDLQQAAGVVEGQVLAGKYRVEKVLGVGGMGVVVAARHIQLDSKVALKFLLPAMLANREAVSRFAQEARAAVRITSEHVARVLDVGTLENGAPYLVMEFLEGGDLAGWLQKYSALPIEQAVEFVLHACVAVADAHGIGIVHRDLKPANLFCVRRSDGQLIVKVLDFGISKTTGLSGGDSGMSMTRTSSVLGSPLYMSPEQMQTPKDVDAATDIWALGVILYELLTAHVPFDGETIAEVAVKAAMHAPVPMRTYRPDMPPGLEAVVARCLEKDRRNRYRNVGELAVALVDFGPRRARASVERIAGIIQASGLSASAFSVAPSVLSPPVVGSQMAPGTVAPVGTTAVSQVPGTRNRTFLFMSLGATAVLCTVAAVAVVGRAPHTSPPAVPAVASLPEPVQAAAVVPPAAAPPPPQVVHPLPEAPPEATPEPVVSTSPRDVRDTHRRVAPATASTPRAPVPSPAAPPPVPAAPPPPPPQPAAETPNPAADPLSRLRVK